MTTIFLMYHDVCTEQPADHVPRSAGMYHVTLEQFEEQMRQIQLSGLRVVTTAEYLAGVTEPSVCLTFDDGWLGTFQHALPLLNELRFPASIFVTRDFVNRRGFCSADDIVRASQQGFEIGVHGTTHRMLSACTRDEVTSEFHHCRQFLEELVDQRIDIASMPGGDWNSMIRSCLRDAGFSVGLTSRPGVNRAGQYPLGLKRIGIKCSTTLDDLKRYCRLNVKREAIRWTTCQIPRWTLGMRQYSKFRRWLLREQAGHANEIFSP